MGRYGPCDSCCRKPPPQIVSFVANFRAAKCVARYCKGGPNPFEGDCKHPCFGDYDEKGKILGYDDVTYLAEWWSTASQNANAAYSEWFGPPGSEQYLEVVPGGRGDAQWGMSRLAYSELPCGACLSSGALFGFPPLSEDCVSGNINPIRYAVAGYTIKNGTGKRYVDRVKYYVIGVADVDLDLPAGISDIGYPADAYWTSFAGTFPDIYYHFWGAWRWDDFRERFNFEFCHIFTNASINFGMGAIGTAWYVGAGNSLWDFGARKIVVRFAKRWLKEETFRYPGPWHVEFQNPLIGETWTPRTCYQLDEDGFGVLTNQCHDGAPVSCRCWGFESVWYGKCHERSRLFQASVDTYVEAASEIPSQMTQDIDVILLAAYIPSNEIDLPAKWHKRFVDSLRTDWDYYRLTTFGPSQWWNGRTPPNSYIEWSTTDTAALQWKPANQNKNAIAVLFIPRLMLEYQGGPVPTTSPITGDEGRVYFRHHANARLGPPLACWIEGSSGGAIT